ncbi:hypothetical protein [Dactylosporangium sp. NPDC051541]|uniref:hypothetical protein n=1 Tax=Dactylosporangium sp. NPDC051541 TaxID=3363977 RepID=UPI003788879A
MPASPSLAQARQHAQTLAGNGDLAAARAALESAVTAGRPGLADRDPELLAAMRELAALHTRAGDPMSARRVLEAAAEAADQRGDADPLALLLAYDLAVAAAELGNRYVARTNFTRVARFGPAALGPAHPAVEHARRIAEEPGTPPAPPPPPASDDVAPAIGVPAGPPSRRRRLWVVAGVVGLLVLGSAAGVVAYLRPFDGKPAAAGPRSSPAPDDSPTPTAGASPTPATAPTPSSSASPKSSAARTPSARPAVTAIAAPADGAVVPWPFDARFTVSPADAASTRTVLAVTVCVAGHCYLDGKLDAPAGKSTVTYGTRLGSTAGEGLNSKWQLRVDRLEQQTYDSLLAEKRAEVAANTWGAKGTTMSALNPTPVASVTLTKQR